MEEQDRTTTTKRHRLVLFPVPLQGHINPMIQLANILYKQGFNISIIHTKFNSIDQTKYPNFKFHQIIDGISTTDTSDVVFLLHKLNVNCVTPFRDCLANLMAADFEEKEHVTCLITDTTWYFTQEVADCLKVPRIAFRTSSICSFHAFDALPLFFQKGYLPKKDAELETEISDFWPLKVKDLPEFKTQDHENAYKLITKVLEITKKSSGLIFNSFKELENNDFLKATKQFHSKTFAIGPLHKYISSSSSSSSSLLQQDRTAISWLNNQSPKSVLYISFGSLAVMNETELFEVALGLANSMQHFLWVIRQDSNFEKYPNGFLDALKQRGCIVKWAPQEEVLAHNAIGGFWTHCGWNSTLESICEGVPMICSPFFGDQMVNSRYVCDVWKVGVLLEKGLKSLEIEFAIRKLMVDEDGEEIRKNVMIFKKKSELSLQNGGSSYQSLKGFTDYILSL